MIRLALGLTLLSVVIAWWQRSASRVPSDIDAAAEARAQARVDTLQYVKQAAFYAAAGTWTGVLLHAAMWGSR